jgi:D-sedoheptulose 7-phosphate isomerase
VNLVFFIKSERKMITIDRMRQAVAESIATKQRILEDSALMRRLEEASELVAASLRQGGKIHFCGNGGSAADAQHLAAELSGRFYYDRPPLNAEALHCNTSYMTAVGNDYGYEWVFARLLRGTGHAGDVLVGLSTSGNSKNILKAYDVCKEMGIRIISLTGETGGKMKEYSDILLNVPSTDTPRIQESHIMLGHILCEWVEADLFPRNA